MSDKLFSWSVVADKTDVTIPFRLLSTAGAAVTGKLATNLTLSYWRQGGTRTAITASDLAAVNSAHSDGGVKEVDATNFPGLYRLDLPDAAVASGADWVCVGVVCSGAMDYETWLPIQSAGTVETYAVVTNGTYGLSALKTLIDALPTAAAITTAVWAAGTRTLTSISALASSIASAVWDAVAASYNTSGTMGAKLNTAATGSGVGASSYTETVTDGSNPLDGVEVWVTTDSGGSNRAASGTTQTDGTVTFMLDAGTYYLWKQLAGYNFTNPETITVT